MSINIDSTLEIWSATNDEAEVFSIPLDLTIFSEITSSCLIYGVSLSPPAVLFIYCGIRVRCGCSERFTHKHRPSDAERTESKCIPFTRPVEIFS